MATFLNVKMQHVQSLFDNFNADREAILQTKNAFVLGKTKPFYFKADVQFLNLPKVPITHLQKLVFENINAPTRALSLMEALDRAVDSLDGLLKMRNGLIVEFRSGFTPEAYFGLKAGDITDGRYASTIKAIYDSTDDCIHFAKLLSEDLAKHGNKVRNKLPGRFLSVAPKIVTADFSSAAAHLPSSEKYPTWQTAFVQAEPALTLNCWRATPVSTNQ